MSAAGAVPSTGRCLQAYLARLCRRAWIANWRASSELEKAKKANDSKAAEVSVLGTLVQESLNRRQELRLELGLAEDGETGVVVPSMEDSADMRVKDRQEWIAAYRAKQGIAPAAGASALAFKEPFQSMVADRRAWIAAWRERTAAKAVVNA